MERVRSIDAFRGIAIVGMIFFTISLKLGDGLPDVLKHNAYSSFHVGDLVLPLFLFISGVSIAHSASRANEGPTRKFYKKVAFRFMKLAIVGILLSPFSAWGFLEMDEVMLSALLFLVCMLLHRCKWWVILLVVFFIDLSYFLVMASASLGPEFTHSIRYHYLGGYVGAIYYIPVMLVGMQVGKNSIKEGLLCRKNVFILMAISLFFVLSFIQVPPYKLEPTPTFMMLSIIVSIALFALVDYLYQHKGGMPGFGGMEYLGRNPLRYWLFMYVVFLIPLSIYASHFNQGIYPTIAWTNAVALALILVPVLWLFGQFMDWASLELKRLFRKN